MESQPADNHSLSFESFEQRIARARRWILLGLVALALLPRVFLAARLNVFCYDGYFYFHVAGELQRGNPEPLLEGLDLNLYPVLLAWGRQLGLSWKTAATALGCALGGLLVLPLYGWVRRLFDERTALAACVLYAAHPEMIEVGIEPIRDGTFWFLLTLWLYCFTRAMREMRWRWFLATGLCFALAVHIRSEGWLLLIVAFCWPLRSFVRKQPERYRVAAGTLCGLALTPLLVVAVNLTVLRDQPRIYAGKMKHFVIAWEWLAGRSESTNDAADAKPSPPVRRARPNRRDVDPPPPRAGARVVLTEAPRTDTAAEHPPPLKPAEASPPQFLPPPLGKRARRFLNNYIKTVGYPNLILLIVGFICWRRSGWRSWEMLSLCIFSIALVAGVWIFYSRFGMTNDRYFLPTVLVLLPIQALGLFAVVRFGWQRLRPREAASPRSQTRTIVTVCILLIAVGFADAVTSRHKSRDADLALARWIKEESQGRPSIVVDRGARRVGFHAAGDSPRELSSHDHLHAQLSANPPEWLLVMRSKFHLREEAVLQFDKEATGLGYRRLSLLRFPKAERRYLLYRRPPSDRGWFAKSQERVVAGSTRTRH